MPNSLKSRLKGLVRKGLLSERDFSRIYTDNDVVEELEKIKEEIEHKKLIVLQVLGGCRYYDGLDDTVKILDNHIAELKGE